MKHGANFNKFISRKKKEIVLNNNTVLIKRNNTSIYFLSIEPLELSLFIQNIRRHNSSQMIYFASLRDESSMKCSLSCLTDCKDFRSNKCCFFSAWAQNEQIEVFVRSKNLLHTQCLKLIDAVWYGCIFPEQYIVCECYKYAFGYTKNEIYDCLLWLIHSKCTYNF